MLENFLGQFALSRFHGAAEPKPLRHPDDHLFRDSDFLKRIQDRADADRVDAYLVEDSGFRRPATANPSVFFGPGSRETQKRSRPVWVEFEMANQATEKKRFAASVRLLLRAVLKVAAGSLRYCAMLALPFRSAQSCSASNHRSSRPRYIPSGLRR